MKAIRHAARFRQCGGSCGAANTVKLLLASSSDERPDGLANGSDQVGPSFMFHDSQAVLALSKEPNLTVFKRRSPSTTSTSKRSG